MRKPKGYWTYEHCKEEALKYKTRSDFKTNSSAAYSISTRNGWHDKICSHMNYIQLPNNYWTKEKCHKEALKFNMKSKFKLNSKSAYTIAHKNKWLEEICLHMQVMQKPKNYWNFEMCKKEALKYKYRNDFSVGSKSAYTSAHRNGWLNEICSHMIKKVKLIYCWTLNKCKQKALKCKTRGDFKKKYRQAYIVSCKNKWIDEICSHIKTKNKPKEYWNYENCKKEALKYKYKTHFIKYSQFVYKIAKENKWIDEICSHMIILGNKYKRLIYAYEFSDNYAYIGLTFNMNKRNAKHLSLTEKKITPVAKHMNDNNVIPILKILTKYLPVRIAQNMEKHYIQEYKNNGWILLNKLDGGGLGASRFI